MADAAGRVAILVLAAGSSRRLGRPKQLLPLDGRPLLQHAVDVAATAGVGEIVVVLGAAAREISAVLQLPEGARIVENYLHTAGQASSLRAGLEALDRDVGRAVVMLGDQPFVTADTVREVAQAPGAIARAAYRGEPGHPVAFDRALWPELLRVTGDRGAREVLARHPELITTVPVDAPPPGDVDTEEDYRRLAGSG